MRVRLLPARATAGLATTGLVTTALVTTALVTTALLLSGCSARPSAANAGVGSAKKLVATTVAPITSIAANIGGDRIQLQGIVPEGTNSHTFEPPPSTAELLSKADLIVVNGLSLEDPTVELANANRKDGTDIVEIGTNSIPESDWIYDFSFPKSDGKPNPHLWTDPLFAIKYAAQLRDAFSKVDPSNAWYYADNYTKFDAKATALATALRADQKTVPAGGLKLLTYHDAYAYFGRDFGWKIIGAVQPKNFEDPTPSEVANLIDQVKAENVRTIFGSEVFPSAVLEEIGRATGARYEDTLRDDDLPGAPGDKDHSWLGLMTYDFTTMVKALGGTPAELAKVETSDVAPDQAIYPQ